MRFLLPPSLKLGPPAFRRWLLNFVPHAGVQRVKRIADEIDHHSRHIYEEKKRAMRAGDAAVMHQIGEGKDIMSKLSESGQDVLARRKLSCRFQCRQTWLPTRRISCQKTSS